MPSSRSKPVEKSEKSNKLCHDVSRDFTASISLAPCSQVYVGPADRTYGLL